MLTDRVRELDEEVHPGLSIANHLFGHLFGSPDRFFGILPREDLHNEITVRR